MIGDDATVLAARPFDLELERAEPLLLCANALTHLTLMPAVLTTFFQRSWSSRRYLARASGVVGDA